MLFHHEMSEFKKKTISCTTLHAGRLMLMFLSICQLNMYKQLSYNREITLQGELVLAKSGKLERGDNILRTS